MNRCDWIICERTNRWAAALRLAGERDAAAGGVRHRFREVRSLSELPPELARRPASLVALEVSERNLGDVLTWLAAALRWFPQSRCVALVDQSLSSADQSVRSRDTNSQRDIVDALREAGTWEVAESPRRLEPLLEVARRHAISAAKHDEIFAENQPFTERMWATLPWQEA